MTAVLQNKRVAILVANGFEQSELTEPKNAIEKAGGKTEIVSPEKDTVRAWKHAEWGDTFRIDISLSQANAHNYDALLLPGGVINPDKLRINSHAIDFIRQFVNARKPVAAICHGPWPLINAGMVRGYRMTSWSSLKLDLVNAGAEWLDQECVVDRNLVTSRNPDDLPAFNEAMIRLISVSSPA